VTSVPPGQICLRLGEVQQAEACEAAVGYYDDLKAAGFDPWLDEPELAASANLERELLRRLEESCAAVFFITDQFKDERYLAAEIDYAIMQERKKGQKFAIVTLRYAREALVPGLLTPYVFKDVVNDLEGFEIVVRALPIRTRSGSVESRSGVMPQASALARFDPGLLIKNGPAASPEGLTVRVY